MNKELINKEKRETEKAFIRAFNSPDGQKALKFLQKQVENNYLNPSATDAELRHLQGQRYIVNLIKTLSTIK